MLPPPPPPPLASQPVVISSSSSHDDYQNSTINNIPSVKPISVVYRNPNVEEHTSTIQSFIDTANVIAHQQQPTMPIYHSEPFQPLYNNFYIRSHEPQQLSYQEQTAFNSNRNNKAMTNLHTGHDQSIHDKNSNSIQLNEGLAPKIGQRPMENPLHLNKSSQPYGHQYYSPTIEPLNRTINQFSFDDGSTSSQINVPSSNSAMVRELTHLSDQINETKIHSKNKSNTAHTIYGDDDDDIVTDMFANQMSGKREMISNSNDIDSMYQNERNMNDKCNEPFKGDTNNDVYANDNGFKSPHIESTDLRKSISNNNSASISNVTLSTTTAATAPATSKYITDFTLNENAQHIPYSASSSTFNDASNERDRYPYESISDRTYTSVHSKESNDDGIGRAHIDAGKRGATLKSNSSSHTLFPCENKQKIIKRRSSIDADSFAKTLGHDTNSERESIAANIRRRYSVAASFLNLPSNAANDTNSFNFTPTVTANEYQNNTRSWVNNNNTLPPGANTIELDHIDSMRIHGNDTGNGSNEKSPFDTNSMLRIDNDRNGSAIIVQNQIDMPMASSVSNTLPIDSNDGYLRHQLSDIGPSQQDENINQYDNGATPYITTAPYTMDDQTYVENAMEQLKLDDNIERIQFDDSADRIRASG